MLMSMIMFTLSWMLVISSHPIMLLVIIMTQTLLVSVSLWINSSNSWISFILFLIFIGGLMVLFVYIVSLASNEIFNMFNMINTYSIVMPAILTTTMFVLMKNQHMEFNYNFNLTQQFNKIYTMAPNYIIVFTMIYLLITLVVAVKISNLKEAPVKNMFY